MTYIVDIEPTHTRPSGLQKPINSHEVRMTLARLAREKTERASADLVSFRIICEELLRLNQMALAAKRKSLEELQTSQQVSDQALEAMAHKLIAIASVNELNNTISDWNLYLQTNYFLAQTLAYLSEGNEAS